MDQTKLVDLRAAYREMGKRQQSMFLYLLKHSSEGPVSSPQLLSDVWDYSFNPGTNLVNVAAYRIRQVIKKHKLPMAVKTIKGKGFQIQGTDPKSDKGEPIDSVYALVLTP